MKDTLYINNETNKIINIISRPALKSSSRSSLIRVYRQLSKALGMIIPTFILTTYNNYILLIFQHLTLSYICPAATYTKSYSF